MRAYQLPDVSPFFSLCGTPLNPHQRNRNCINPKNREDAATAEVSRSQLWQWVRHGVTTAEGKKVDKQYALRLLKECADELAAKAPKGNKFGLAAQYFAGQVTGEDYADFLTTLLYDEITAAGSPSPASKL